MQQSIGPKYGSDGYVWTWRGDDLAEFQDVGVEVVVDSRLSHAASGAAREVS